MRGATVGLHHDAHGGQFQSTRPVRGATAITHTDGDARIVSIHAPRAGRDWSQDVLAHPVLVSIHAPRAGRDDEFDRQGSVDVVSIHAPRAGRDSRYVLRQRRPKGFNPRAPCGARLRNGILNLHLYVFQSTRPVRGATPHHLTILIVCRSFNPRAPCGARPGFDEPCRVCVPVSIHAPRAGRDNPIFSHTII